jgi:adenosylmethionine-8-amino-7-oxononanoate aminotransferase
MARQYFLEIGQPGRRHFVARWQSYHGNTLGALAVGGNRWRRAQFQPLLVDVQHVEPCYPYRGKAEGESDEAYVDRLIGELEATLERLGPETVIGFVAEPVVGATMGAVPALPGYLKRVKEVLDRHGILMILDEVMCGMGRTGTLYACEQDGVAPDLVTVAKGLGAGYQPIGAVMVAQKIHDAIRDGSGFFQHGHTYIGHPTACAAALAVQKTIQDEQLLGAVKARGARFAELLESRFADHPHIGDIRGRGLFRGLEIVADRATKTPFAPASSVHARLKKEAMARGLICYPGLGTIDGERGHHVLLAPPFITTDEQLETISDRLAAALDASLAGVAREAA